MAETFEALEFHEVDASRWDDLETLFEGRGGPKHCWCMVWRRTSAEAKTFDRKARKAALKQRVDEREPIGLLAYLDREPVAWCSIAPRDSYRPLGGPADDEGVEVWSLVCFFARADLRGQGVTSRLLRAAVEHAGARGAQIVEAYPVDPDSPSYRFMGFQPTFRAAGFEEVGLAGTRRHVMRLRLDRPPGRASRGATPRSSRRGSG